MRAKTFVAYYGFFHSEVEWECLLRMYRQRGDCLQFYFKVSAYCAGLRTSESCFTAYYLKQLELRVCPQQNNVPLKEREKLGVSEHAMAICYTLSDLRTRFM